ncbi:4488_t:CDS:2 [Dentiscutata heterogama]|uniref:4488_t:CDS:1 n=1 Tax=Dentiscutata heterogama TaxID=1316150 RepID=A0ACA9L8A1_9GLOM|nr:4488_t:CDS:2 [Dentiscutata heterogama]
MPSEIKENEIDASDEVTHLEFVGDRASASSENIALLEKFLECCRLVTDKVIDEIVQYCSNLEFLSVVGTNITKDALSKLNPKIMIKRDSTLEMDPEKELNDLRTSLVYLVQDLWSTYANLEDIVQYCEDKIKDEHYQNLIIELERDMRGTAERLGLMVRMYGLKEKINYQPTNPEYNTNYVITEFVPRDIKYIGRESLSSHMKFQTPRSEFHQRLYKNEFFP